VPSVDQLVALILAADGKAPEEIDAEAFRRWPRLRVDDLIAAYRIAANRQIAEAAALEALLRRRRDGAP
jgi:hypothetical protein